LTFPHPGLYWIYGNKDDDIFLVISYMLEAKNPENFEEFE
jgi:hypothetical protein